MKNTIAMLVIGFLLINVSVYAASVGELAVSGNAGIG